MSDEMSQRMLEGMPEGQTECQEISQKYFFLEMPRKSVRKNAF